MSTNQKKALSVIQAAAAATAAVAVAMSPAILQVLAMTSSH
jgi:hypothetical protein